MLVLMHPDDVAAERDKRHRAEKNDYHRDDENKCMADSVTFEKFAKPMSDKDFMRLREFIHSRCGIKMPPPKKIMLEARLQKRLRSLGITSFREYFEYLFESPAGKEEVVHMIDSVTTNKTDFFREPAHFSYLAENILQEFMRTEGGKAFMVWSAGCSSGEEPYTLAMVLNKFREEHPGFRFSILATDISTKVLEKARLGIYDQERITPVPSSLKQKCFMRSRDQSRGLVRIVPELRSLVRFQRLNLMADNCVLSEPADAIFCRNVIIYFEHATQERLLGRLCRSLKPGGYLFLGHSENVHGFDLSLVRVLSTVYRKIS
jgi:chemotaxis protein methyltransferase CheR